MERKAETKVVKNGLLAAGFDVRSVSHGKGTSWGWLSITIAKPLELACEEHGSYMNYDHKDCDACCSFTQTIHDMDRKVIAEAQKLTGRKSSEYNCYDGNISTRWE